MKIKTVISLFAILLLFGLAIRTGFSVLWLFAIFASVLILSSLIMIIVARFFVKFEQYVQDPVIIKGMSTKIILGCYNKTIFIFPRVIIKYVGGNVEEIALAPGKYKHALVFKPERKGVYDVGIEKIIMTDLFEFFKYTVKIKTKEKIYAMPTFKELILLNDTQTNEYASKETKVNKFENKNIISDLREYKYGDTLNKINWKATAKLNEVIVNNYENRYCYKSYIYVDSFFGNEQESTLEENLMFDDFACEITMTLINNIIMYSGQLSLLYAGKESFLDGDTVKAMNEFGMYLTERVNVDTYEQDLTTMENMVMNTANYSRVIFIVRDIKQEIREIAKAVRNANIDCIVYKITKLDENKLGVSIATDV